MGQPFFPTIERVRYEGRASANALAFRWYDADRIVLGKRLSEHLRPAACYWHSFCWDGTDMFGAGTFARPWLGGGDAMALAARKTEVAFEFFEKLDVPFFTFHDRDVAPEGATLAASNANLARAVEGIAAAMERTGVRLLWGTANLFSHRRYAAGAATNPDPEVFAYAAAQVKQAMDVTRQLGGAGYVLWGGREGYDTLLNTDLGRELEQLGRFMSLVVDYRHRSGFAGTLLIEPKPMEPTKHQYDRDAAAVHAFLQRFGLEREIRLNIEANHATLAGHSFEHEIAYAIANDLLGSVDINRGDPQNGWDTDQFPNSVEELTLVLYRILAAGGLGNGGFNFDAKLRRQSVDPLDLFHAHIGGMDTLARALINGAALLESRILAAEVKARYAGWDGRLGQAILRGSATLDDLAAQALADGLDPAPRSGGQERLENAVSRAIDAAATGSASVSR
ncbi:xylose isomerase [Candidatus Binatia bacterium]|nr:xylose isomerase [Candidatus Binatia bacterium]